MTLSKDTLQKLAELVALLERDNPKLDLRIRCAVLRYRDGTITLPTKNLSLEELEPWFWSMATRNETTGCWEWIGTRDENGYGRFKVKGKRWLAHRASLHYVVGDSPLFSCHRCSNPPCINPFHLYYGTRSENWRDMLALGRGFNPIGSSNGRARLTEHDVAFIRSSSLKLRELGQLYDMDKQNICRIKNGHLWKHVKL